MNTMQKTALTLALAGTTGCSGGPYDVGVIVKSTAEVQSVTTSYREVSGKGVQESVGTIGSASECSEARSSAGQSLTQWIGEEKVNIQVVGETLVPVIIPDDSHDQEDVWVSLIMQTTRSAGTSYTSTRTSGSGSSDVTEETLVDEPVTTDVSYYGVTAEDYIAAFELATLWPSGGGLEESDAELLTKHKPRKGDVWFSQNGNSIYMFAGYEALTVSAESLKVAKVEVYEASDVAVADDGIMDTCINNGRDQYAGSGDDYDDEVAMLDAGCEDSFRHAQTGTQWWHKGILVKEDTENVDVDIVDFGWEWYEESEGACYRQTSTHRPDDEAEMFIEYELTTSTVSRIATDWIKAP